MAQVAGAIDAGFSVEAPPLAPAFCRPARGGINAWSGRRIELENSRTRSTLRTPDRTMNWPSVRPVHRVMRTNFYVGVSVVSLLALCPLSRAFAADAENPAPSVPTSETDAATAKSRPEKPLPRNVADVVKLVKSGVDASVITAFIDASSTVFQPSAQDLVRLRDEGVSAAVIVAMLKHQPAVREVHAEAPVQPAPPVVQPPPEQVAPPVMETVQGPTVIYSGSYPDYYPYYYYNYWYGWPLAYYHPYYWGSHYRGYGRSFYPGIHYHVGAPRASFGVGVGGFHGGVRVGGGAHFGGGFHRR